MPLFPLGTPPSQVTPNLGVCSPWATTADLCEPCVGDGFTMDATLMANCLQIASDILFELTGRQWPGLCTDTVRPTGRNIVSDHGRPIGGGYNDIVGYVDPGWLAAGGGYTAAFGALGNQTERTGGYPVSEVTLGAYPVTSIQQVIVGGQIVDPSQYRIDDNRWLVRLADPVTGAPRFWPFWVREDQDSTQANTFSVTLTYGTAPPKGGVHACALYACQLALSASPKTAGSCMLPQRVKNITRQGINAVLIDPMDFIKDGRTGLVAVDAWIRSKNPGGISRRMTVSHPSLQRRVRRAGPHG